MPVYTDEDLRDEAARDPLARVETDHEAAPDEIRPLLRYIANHLFDPGLNVNGLKRACAVRDNSLTLVFHSRVGTPPKAYISDRRLETAATLLRETNLRIWKIAELVGYSGIAVFGKAFDRWSGMRPGQYRKANPPAGNLRPQMTDNFLTEALTGRLSNGEATELMLRILEKYVGPIEVQDR